MAEIGHKVKVSYIGTLDDGTVFDSTEFHDNMPLEFTVGRQEMIPGFDLAVSQMVVGETRTVHIEPKMAYGERDESLIQAFPASAIPHAEQLPIGEFIVMRTDSGSFRMRILSLIDGQVTVDLNHELAGMPVNFEITLLEEEGVGLSAVERELQGGGCACGCDRLRDQIDPLENRELPAGYEPHHHHEHGENCTCGH